jgi:hypothetical protein
MLNCGAAACEKQILRASRDFTFPHSQGHSRRFDRTTAACLPPPTVYFPSIKSCQTGIRGWQLMRDTKSRRVVI